eukprot:UN25452
MPEWAKNMKDGEEVKMDDNVDISDSNAYLKGDGEKDFEYKIGKDADYKYDLEEANAFIRMRDAGRIDQDYFENYILPSNSNEVKFD